MKTLHFLCKVLEKEDNGVYKIIVNTDNMHYLPDGNTGEKRVVCSRDLKLGDVLYISNAQLDEETRSVTVQEYTVIKTSEDLGSEIDPELLNIANLSEYTPLDLMNIIYPQEQIEEDDEEEATVSDSEDEEGD